jgi:hypothetical protein
MNRLKYKAAVLERNADSHEAGNFFNDAAVPEPSKRGIPS